MSEPTPGEWQAVAPKKQGKHWKIVAKGTLGGGGAIGAASVMWSLAMIDNGAPGDTLETEAANAHLFAAAKELLVACRRSLELSQHADGCAWFQIPTKELNGTPQSQARQLAACNCHLADCRQAIAKAEGQ